MNIYSENFIPISLRLLFLKHDCVLKRLITVCQFQTTLYGMEAISTNPDQNE